MTNRRPLGTGPALAELSRADDSPPTAPRAPLAAERLPAAVPAATEPAPTPPRPAGRRTLGAGPAPSRVPGASAAG
ncbi:hypothetical protein DIZ27_44315 [Streptomyces sp. NWU339]|uniref:hypothetical protein n=1 Tax=Streptomyces sp. NWU339 TaxID=2185284 RepID=UPI000D6826A5|nr:hypothetical protein [Streptomyces sp. NWU339]PWI04611.1 hypothetical protein DIZ27_44315 [Streptomyces sp. NWU339]